MNNQQAKQTLVLYRPGAQSEPDEEMTAALAQTAKSPELDQWFVRQRAFNGVIQGRLRGLNPPADLKDRILAQRLPAKGIVWWRRPQMLALAASIVLLLALTGYWINPRPDNDFAAYRARMAKTALREYRMDMVSSDLQQIGTFLAQHGSPSDYALSPELKRLPGLGCALLKWQSQPVSMICFRKGQAERLWLFVTTQAALGHAPATPKAAFAQVGRLGTATWSQDGKTYLLAGIGNPQLLRKYL
jgi:uncharacterized membrane protein YbaN (DUF454 family)